MWILLAVLVPIVVVDVMNPVLLGATIYTLGTRRPVRHTLALLAGWLGVYLVAGVGIALGLDAVIDRLQNPLAIDFWIQFVLGFGLLVLTAWVVWPGASHKPRDPAGFEKRRPATEVGLWGALMLGAGVNLVSLPFALPYFGAVDQILKADLSVAGAVVVLLIYNVLYVLPFGALIGLRMIWDDRADRYFKTINHWMGRINRVVMPVLISLLGLVMVADAGLYLSTGTPLFPTPPPPEARPPEAPPPEAPPSEVASARPIPAGNPSSDVLLCAIGIRRRPVPGSFSCAAGRFSRRPGDFSGVS